MLKCHVSLCCSNSLNSSDSSLYDWYDDGISSSSPHMCATGLGEAPLRAENYTSVLSQLIISLPIINCRDYDSDFPCNHIYKIQKLFTFLNNKSLFPRQIRM